MANSSKFQEQLNRCGPFALDGPVRTPARRRSSRCTTGSLPTIESNCGGHWQSEGRLDFDFQLIMSVAPHVIAYREQPETFVWRDGRNVTRRYTPDGLAITTMGAVYFEVKPERWLAQHPNLDGKLDDIEAECRQRNARFAIVSEAHIRVGHLLPNSRRVWSASQQVTQGDLIRACAKLAALDFPISLKDICCVLGEYWSRLVNGLIGHKYLAVDLNQPLSEDLRVCRGLKPWP